MRCDSYHEATSATLDGEPPGVPAAALDEHRHSCAACAAWTRDVEEITRRVRVRRAESAPADLVDRVMASVVLPPPRPTPRRLLVVLRAALVLTAVVQAAVSAPALVGDDVGMAMATHASHEAAAWNLALAAGLALVAARPRRAAGALGVVGPFVAVLAALSVVDVVAGRVGAERLVTHLAAVVGVGLLVGVVRVSRPAAPGARRWGREPSGHQPGLAGTRRRPRHRPSTWGRVTRSRTSDRLTATRRRTRTGAVGLLLGVLLGLLLAGLATAAPALAHATVVRTSPADGSDQATAPSAVSVTFDEAVGLDPGYLQVVDGDGGRVDVGGATHAPGDPATVTVAVHLPTRPGGYLASYRVVSDDGHPVGGTFRFTVGGGAPLTSGTTTSSGGSSGLLGGLLDLATAVSYVGLALAGGAWLVISRRAGVADSRRARLVVRAGLVLAAVAVAVQLALDGPYLAGDGATAGAGRLFVDTLTSPSGAARLVELAGLLVALAVSVPVARLHEPLHGARLVWPAVAGAAWLVTLTGVAAAGHARVRSPVWLQLPSTVVHLLAVTAWAGGLVLLLVVVVPADGRPGAAALARRFSRVALVAVVAIAVTGAVQAWVETGSVAALVDTTYGVLLLVKIALLAVLVGLGALARRHLRRGDALRPLRSGVVVELALVLAVFAVTSVLVAQPPARVAHAEALARRPAAATVALDDTRSARLVLAPGHTGPVAVTVTLTGGAPPEEVTLTAALPARRLGPVPVPLRPGADRSRWTAGGVDLPVAGRWHLELTVRTSTFDAVVATADLDIG